MFFWGWCTHSECLIYTEKCFFTERKSKQWSFSMLILWIDTCKPLHRKETNWEEISVRFLLFLYLLLSQAPLWFSFLKSNFVFQTNNIMSASSPSPPSLIIKWQWSFWMNGWNINDLLKIINMYDIIQEKLYKILSNLP